MRKIVKKQIMHNAKDVLYRKEGNSRHIQKTEKPLSFFNKFICSCIHFDEQIYLFIGLKLLVEKFELCWFEEKL